MTEGGADDVAFLDAAGPSSGDEEAQGSGQDGAFGVYIVPPKKPLSIHARPEAGAPVVRRAEPGERLVARPHAGGWLELELSQGWVMPEATPLQPRTRFRRAMTKLLHRKQMGAGHAASPMTPPVVPQPWPGGPRTDDGTGTDGGAEVPPQMSRSTVSSAQGVFPPAPHEHSGHGCSPEAAAAAADFAEVVRQAQGQAREAGVPDSPDSSRLPLDSRSSRRRWLPQRMRGRGATAAAAAAAAMPPKQQQRRQLVGTVTVEVLQFRGLNGKRLHCDLYIEGERHRVPKEGAVECKDFQGWPVKGGPSCIPVTDVAADLNILVFADNRVRGEGYQGRVVVPLSSLLPASATELVLGLIPPRAPPPARVTAWHELFPLAPTRTKYPSLVRGVVNSGMPRPKGQLARVLLKVEVTADRPWLHCYALQPPVVPLGEATPARYERRFMKGGAHRLRRIRDAAATEPIGPDAQLFLWCAWVYVAVLSPVWQFPFAAAATVCATMYLMRPKADVGTPLFWQDEAERPPTFLEKQRNRYRRLRKWTAKLQRWACALASVVEAGEHLLSWSDPRATTLVAVLAVSGGFVASVAMYFTVWVCQFLPSFVPRLAIFAAGALAAPPMTRAARRKIIASSTSVSLSQTQSSRASSSSGSDESDEAEDAVDDSSSVAQAQTAGVRTHHHQSRTLSKLGFFGLWLTYLRHALARLPDSLEDKHRRIAAAQRVPPATVPHRLPAAPPAGRGSPSSSRSPDKPRR
eukprot:TRINITY_DN30525_c0_g1_i1.p1 TRINITY_DN30525_c0_g1~~TRINITY_DN30525_c0_g1_i1.p1  ORF type:complete len:747 (+),score=184.25 TRINITY_DN30525_c0_g1_i1:218-2458(+)